VFGIGSDGTTTVNSWKRPPIKGRNIRRGTEGENRYAIGNLEGTDKGGNERMENVNKNRPYPSIGLHN